MCRMTFLERKPPPRHGMAHGAMVRSREVKPAGYLPFWGSSVLNRFTPSCHACCLLCCPPLPLRAATDDNCGPGRRDDDSRSLELKNTCMTCSSYFLSCSILQHSGNSSTQSISTTMSYAYLFKYIIIGDTGTFMLWGREIFPAPNYTIVSGIMTSLVPCDRVVLGNYFSLIWAPTVVCLRTPAPNK